MLTVGPIGFWGGWNYGGKISSLLLSRGAEREEVVRTSCHSGRTGASPVRDELWIGEMGTLTRLDIREGNAVTRHACPVDSPLVVRYIDAILLAGT
jgi:hypothetical protein